MSKENITKTEQAPRLSLKQILQKRMTETEYGGEVTLAETTGSQCKIGLSATRAEWEQIVNEHAALQAVAKEAELFLAHVNFGKLNIRKDFSLINHREGIKKALANLAEIQK